MAPFPNRRSPLQDALARTLSICLSAAATGVRVAAADLVGPVNTTTVALLLVLIVLAVARQWGWLEALVAAIVAGLGLDYFFIPPRGFGIEQPEHWIVFVVFLVTAVAAGQLSARANRHKAEAVQRRAEIETLYRLADAISEGGNADVLQGMGDSLRKILELEAVAICDKASGRIWRSSTLTGQMTDDLLRRVAVCSEPFNNPASGVLIVPIRENGVVAGSIGIAGTGVPPALLRAATEKVATAIARSRAAERAKEAEIARRADELKSAVFDALAHEARGPLGTINIAVTTLMSDGPGDAAQQSEMLGVIKEEVARLNRWIDATALISRTDAGQLIPNKAPWHLEELIGDALATFGQGTGDRRISVEIADSMPMAYCDTEIIRRVLHLLLENALKYSPPGSPISVTAGLDSVTGMVVVSVLDAGPGIPEAEQERVFEKHYRGARKNSIVPGTGLGLASAKCLVESHDGEIWVTNRPGGGAAFHFSLPASHGAAA